MFMGNTAILREYGGYANHAMCGGRFSLFLTHSYFWTVIVHTYGVLFVGTRIRWYSFELLYAAGLITDYVKASTPIKNWKYLPSKSVGIGQLTSRRGWEMTVRTDKLENTKQKGEIVGRGVQSLDSVVKRFGGKKFGGNPPESLEKCIWSMKGGVSPFSTFFGQG